MERQKDVATAKGAPQSSSMDWKLAAFLVDQCAVNAGSSGSTRVPGETPRSRRPQWTPEKHDHTVSTIKKNLGLDNPSKGAGSELLAPGAESPRKTGPDSGPEMPDAKQWKFFEVFTRLAYGLGNPTSARGPASGLSAPRRGPSLPPSVQLVVGSEEESRRNTFMEKLLAMGVRESRIAATVAGWVANGIPQNQWTVPTFVGSTAEYSVLGHGSGAQISHIKRGEEAYVIKCYPPRISAGVDDVGYLEVTAGINPLFPRQVLRNVLTSRIARDVFGWNELVPKIDFVDVNKGPCSAMPYWDGIPLTEIMDADPLKKKIIEDTFLPGTWDPRDMESHFGKPFTQAFIRLDLLTKLVGAIDVHPGQFFVERSFKSVWITDWDHSFGPKIQTDANHHVRPVGFVKDVPEFYSSWPNAIPQKICDEFVRATVANLREPATRLELTPEEKDALIDRWKAINLKLATIKKTAD